MRDVAMRAGVSAKTVSRVMNNDRYVSDDVRERVMRAVSELEYVPNAMAKSFRSGQASAIGIAVPVLDPFFSQVVQTIEEIARSRGVAVFVTCLGDDPDDEQPAVESLLSRNLAGLIIAPIAQDQSYLKPWRNHTAMLFIDRRPKRFVADSIIGDDYDGARKIIDHLIAHGHRRIAFAGDSTSPCRRPPGAGRSTSRRCSTRASASTRSWWPGTRIDARRPAATRRFEPAHRDLLRQPQLLPAHRLAVARRGADRRRAGRLR